MLFEIRDKVPQGFRVLRIPILSYLFPLKIDTADHDRDFIISVQLLSVCRISNWKFETRVISLKMLDSGLNSSDTKNWIFKIRIEIREFGRKILRERFQCFIISSREERNILNIPPS